MKSKNEKRASRGTTAVNSYRKRVGGRYIEETFLVAAVDLIADILHSVEEKGGDAHDFVRVAWDHFIYERRGNNDVPTLR